MKEASPTARFAVILARVKKLDEAIKALDALPEMQVDPGSLENGYSSDWFDRRDDVVDQARAVAEAYRR
jgi:hypothetical protein